MNDGWASVRVYLLRSGEGSEEQHPRTDTKVCSLCMGEAGLLSPTCRSRAAHHFVSTLHGSSRGTGVFLGFSWRKLEPTSSLWEKPAL